MGKNKLKFIVLHHSWTKDGKFKDATAIRKYHMKTNGWDDIGYHYLIENVKGCIRVIKGRMEMTPGAHAIGFNRKSIGICVVGNYDKHGLPKDKRKVLVDLLIHLCKFELIIPENIIGHWQTYEMRSVKVKKTCPGLKFPLKEIYEEVASNVEKWKKNIENV